VHRAQLRLGQLRAVDEVGDQALVGGGVEQRADGGRAVTAGAARLLVVLLGRGRDRPVHDRAHVGLVDAHAECGGRGDRLQLAGQELLERGRALVGGQAGVVGRRADAIAEQVRGHLLAGLAAPAVDDGRKPLAVLQVRQQHARLACLAGHVQHLQEQVGAVEAGAGDHRVAQLQRGHDVAGHAWRGRRGQSQRRGGAEPLAHVRQPQVVGPEVVPPLRQAVRLVDREAVDVGLADRVQEAATGEAFGGDVDQTRTAGGDAGEGHAHLLAGHVRGDHLDVLVAAGAKGGRLVLHQRDQG
jgi:hypothetical protein